MSDELRNLFNTKNNNRNTNNTQPSQNSYDYDSYEEEDDYYDEDYLHKNQKKSKANKTKTNKTIDGSEKKEYLIIKIFKKITNFMRGSKKEDIKKEKVPRTKKMTFLLILKYFIIFYIPFLFIGVLSTTFENGFIPQFISTEIKNYREIYSTVKDNLSDLEKLNILKVRYDNESEGDFTTLNTSEYDKYKSVVNKKLTKVTALKEEIKQIRVNQNNDIEMALYNIGDSIFVDAQNFLTAVYLFLDNPSAELKNDALMKEQKFVNTYENNKKLLSDLEVNKLKIK